MSQAEIDGLDENGRVLWLAKLVLERGSTEQKKVLSDLIFSLAACTIQAFPQQKKRQAHQSIPK